MLDIVFTCFNTRSLYNYAPLLKYVESRGGRVSLLSFPRVCDPDHVGLMDTQFATLGSYPIDENGTLHGVSLNELAEVIGSPDILMLGTCNIGPEKHVGRFSRARFTIGMQHGLFQIWNDYDNNEAIPNFGVFGSAFRESLNKPTVITGLPKLDFIEPVVANRDGDILYAAQSSTRKVEILTLLRKLEAASGRRVVVRPHPEGRNEMALLADYFEFVDPEEALTSSFKRASLVITTGSTVGLEALVAGVPLVVLPDYQGEEFEASGVVARDLSPEAILEKWANPPDLQATNQFLLERTGSWRNDRTIRAYSRLVELASI